ncbi:hypothetical protein [Leeuwenhoekiella marinoflava]|uniref:Uncharacterized protein n=2 Tax=Leeuwenhoekiella marinoflava TaxID=988 RepID=A0A4Q0P664_9FLAO|nr:hypothetical protein [Leeuwenhoekiella marinoflava]RXG21698.1 hypothetical protein DSL99_4022 [Leeuwenhoekiella marinoflava]SHF76028.1 hypothetical protein SAMN02745246_03347 [Leeuwenhoekiella marinoflava DSM 3653]
MSKLSLYDFKILSDHEQYDVVFSEGTFIDALIEENTRYALYAVDLFFVEIEYDVARNKIVGKTSFVTGEKLNRYSKFI